MTCNTQAFSITQGDSLIEPIVVKAGGIVMNLTGSQLKWTLKKSVSQATPTLQKILVITNPTAGESLLEASSVEMNIEPGMYLWEIEITDALGKKTTTPTQKLMVYGHHAHPSSIMMSGTNITINIDRGISIDIVTKQGPAGPSGATGGQWQGAYSPITQYAQYSLVQYLGKTYIAKYPTLGNLPTDTNFWDLFAEVTVFTLTGSSMTETLENGQSCIISIPIVGISESGNNFPIVTNGSLFPPNIVYHTNIRGTDTVEVYIENQSGSRVNPFRVDIKVLKF